jgi:hypothetical protein
MFFIAGIVLGLLFGLSDLDVVQQVAGRVVFQYMALGANVAALTGSVSAWANLIFGLAYTILTAYLGSVNFWARIGLSAIAFGKLALPIGDILIAAGLAINLGIFLKGYSEAGCM